MPMSPKQLNKRNIAIKVADSLNSIEGVPVSNLAKELSFKWANGIITAKEMKEMLLNSHRRA